MPAPSLAFASSLDPTSFDHACEQISGFRVGPLHDGGQFGSCHLTLTQQLSENLKLLEAERRALLILLLQHPLGHGHVRWTAREDGNDMVVRTPQRQKT
jgi:hypothetical protein